LPNASSASSFSIVAPHRHRQSPGLDPTGKNGDYQPFAVAASLVPVRRTTIEPRTNLMLKPNLWTLFALIAGAAATRLAPHWWNLTAVGAVCLFGGAYFQRKWAAFVVPLAALAISDVFLQTFVHPEQGLDYFKNFGFAINYLCVVTVVPLGMLLHGRTKPLPVAAAAVSGSALFFLLSNFAVWAFGDGSGLRMYPLTPAGLLACYVAALPFSLNSLYGDLLFTGVLFSGMEYYKSRSAALAGNSAIA
jgi:hypothetical protein